MPIVNYSVANTVTFVSRLFRTSLTIAIELIACSFVTSG
jgi:hypothetical protein